MKLLIFTQAVDKNNQALAFFLRWIEEFAKHAQKITVICLHKGEYKLPENVKVLSLGKETLQLSRLPASGFGGQAAFPPAMARRRLTGSFQLFSKFRYSFNFFRYIWRERKNYDTVFVHMNPEYVVLGGLFWRISRKKIGLWYTHRSRNLKLRIALLFSHIVFTASEMSFTLPSSKVHVLGHGIDISKFENIKKDNDSGRIIEIAHIGRITPIKNLETLVLASAILRKEWKRNFKVVLVGAPAMDLDNDYLEKIKMLIKENNLQEVFSFKGSVSQKDIAEVYKSADITVNLTPTGGIDKAVLESMASGVPVFSSNEAFRTYFGQFADILIFREKDPIDLAKKIKKLYDEGLSLEIGTYLKERASKDAGIGPLITKIVKLLKWPEPISK